MLLYLTNDSIHYEVFEYNHGLWKSTKNGVTKIEEGNWDYLSALEVESNQVIVTYGTDVDNPLDLQFGYD